MRFWTFKSQKLSMLEEKEKQGQFWNLHQIPHKTSYPDFRFSSYFFFIFLMIEDFQIKLQLLIFSPEKNWKKQKQKKSENRDTKFC